MTSLNNLKLETTKVENFESWLLSRQYWEQYVWHLHLEKETLDEIDINKCYQYLLEDYGVAKKTSNREELSFAALTLDKSTKSTAKVRLIKICNLKDVNAVVDECCLEFGGNLSVVYGDNGSGKSGIGRLLSNACLSRKPRKLLPDVKKNSLLTDLTAKADFYISNDKTTSILKYNMGDFFDVLKCFSVFDNESAPIHLNNENEIKFVPSKIKIFDDVFKSLLAIESKLHKETQLKAKDNPIEGLFNSSTRITEFLNSLSHETKDTVVSRVLNFGPRDQTLIKEKQLIIEKLQKRDVVLRKKELIDEQSDLLVFKNSLASTANFFTKQKARFVNDIIKDIKEKKEIADKLSIKNFEFKSFKHIGSGEWKSLICAAKILHDKEKSSHGKEPEYCLLCRQSLKQKERILFNDYWNFLKSTAETELEVKKDELIKVLDDLEQIKISWPVFSNTNVAVKILNKDCPEELKKIKGGFKSLHLQLCLWIKNIKVQKEVVHINPLLNLTSIDRLINQKHINESKLVDPTSTINKIKNYIIYLEHKHQATNLMGKIKEYLSYLRWIHAIEKINIPSIRGNTTRKKTEIMNKLVISEYIKIFNEETKKLDCNFDLAVEAHGRDVATIKELKLKFANGYCPRDILSEGEQTVSALADFLTEATIDEHNCGIIFDDPVNSLDHDRRSNIAKRLVHEAKHKQVIVLTHDIVFLLELQNFANSNSIDCVTISMRRSGDRIGIVKPELPWIAQDVKKRVGYLKNELVALKKLENDDPDIYRNQVKLWSLLLREAWERAVEERLFKGVIQRFNRSVQTQRLDRIDVTPELIKELTDGMTESSKWLHDESIAINSTTPKNQKLTADLVLLENFIDKCLAA